jgi:hypothetical protein
MPESPQQENKTPNKSFFKIGVTVMLVTLSLIGGTPEQAKASTYTTKGEVLISHIANNTASVLTSIDSFFSSLFGHTPEEATPVASSSPVSDSYTPPNKTNILHLHSTTHIN